ncbi:FadR/GntR family transcriptional regulator [Paenibacillus nasutitermitis]|uniref:GntR family transcriptional regulator n=1 Tax=Paenibacillus nasutitermitis TaxID=1652958 RepID=A0A916YJP3_9BACL|nr:FadR/GntR family transcriptional regulator [Paenibacillus nasutitermitis]GGD48747.1 GntR family transcriptional regulator [Paenibacillus nasutitermitis]
MSFAKITNRKIYEQIADQLKQFILEGGWRSGEKLPSTKELSEQFQVGRSTMREALSALRAMGLIDIRQGEGCFVRSVESAEIQMPVFESLLLSKEAIFELLESRIALEAANASIASTRRTEEDLAAFRQLLHSMQEHLGDEASGEAADIEFHRLLAAATHNSIMVRLLDTISSQMEAAIREARRIQIYGSKQVSVQLWEEHEAIFKAVEERDPAGAEKAMRTHLTHVERVLRNYLGKTEAHDSGDM